jgi:hypothetical protein
MVRMPTKAEGAVWRKLHKEDPQVARDREERQRSCSHGHWHHRNDGKISTCSMCGKIRDNEP